ncbi:MAG: hypothetical protein HKN01_03780 [Acidimicrobiia bacterium]|nr:hypothetical protein [Acidimicrobiia bacterium]
MTTITTPLRRSHRNTRTTSAPVSARARRIVHHLRWVGESLNSDDRARVCDQTLLHYTEARSVR